VDEDLIRLGRVHRSGEIERAVRAARSAGFDNVNLDLMFALPGQSVAAWKANLERALALTPEHLSLYCLTLEPNTPFYTQNLRGQLTQPDEDCQVAMYDLAVEVAERAGYRQYEISNFAKPGRESRHNLCYWRAEGYAGYGPGAVGFVDRRRYTNWKHPDGYCEALEMGNPVAFEEETIDADTHRIERIMLGIRLKEGLDHRAVAVSREGLMSVLNRGWVEDDGRLKLTAAGRHFCSEVALALIGD
jgi:oxygen-independent coproporphyrinogen-3 oxidase